MFPSNVGGPSYQVVAQLESGELFLQVCDQPNRNISMREYWVGKRDILLLTIPLRQQSHDRREIAIKNIGVELIKRIETCQL